MRPELCYYAGTGGGQTTPEEGGVAFRIYRHEEDWTSTYNVRLRKYDHETGKALEDAVFPYMRDLMTRTRLIQAGMEPRIFMPGARPTKASIKTARCFGRISALYHL